MNKIQTIAIAILTVVVLILSFMTFSQQRILEKQSTLNGQVVQVLEIIINKPDIKEYIQSR